MELGIRGKSALVVGASKGIGRAIAMGFAGEGCRLCLVARNKEMLEVLAAEAIAGGCPDCVTVAADITGGNTVSLARRLLDDVGQLDIVVQNVGGPLNTRDPLAPADAWSKVWYFNAGAAIDINSVLLPPMIARHWGRVVHVSSISAQMLRGSPQYASAKAYLNAYVTTVGRAVAKDGVVVSAVMPGAVAFPGSYWDTLTRENPERCDKYLEDHQAAGRFGTPEEMAGFVLLLASQHATFAQGSVVPISGGSM